MRTTSFFLGISTVTFLRLCWRAPVMMMRSSSIVVPLVGPASPAQRKATVHCTGKARSGSEGLSRAARLSIAAAAFDPRRRAVAKLEMSPHEDARSCHARVASAARKTYTLPARRISLLAPETHGKDAKIIGGSAGAGALVGAVVDGKSGAAKGALVGGGAGTGVVPATRGQEVSIPAGSRWRVRLAGPLVVDDLPAPRTFRAGGA